MTNKANICKECGFKIRGANHEDGAHHRNAKAINTSGPRALRRAKAHRRHGIKTNIGDPNQDLNAGQFAMFCKGFFPGEKA